MRHLKISLVVCLEVLAFCAALVVLGTLLVCGRLMLGPLTITELTPVFENMLSAPDHGVIAKIARSELTWDKEHRRAVLDLANIRFTDKDNQNIATIPELMMALHPMGYFDASRSPWNVMVQNPHMQVRLDNAGAIHLGAHIRHDDVIAVNQSKQKNNISEAELLELIRDILRSPHTRASGLGLFANVTIINGSIVMNDESGDVKYELVMPALTFRRIHDDYVGKAALILSKNTLQAPIEFALDYNASKKVFSITGSFDHLNPGLFAGSFAQLKAFDIISSPLTGTINLAFDEAALIVDGGMNLNLDKGEVRIPDLYGAPLAFKSGQIVARYNKQDNILRLDPMRFDFEHMTLKGEADIHTGSTPRDIKTTFRLSGLPVKEFPNIWPEQAGKNARDWILENVHKGILDEAVLNLVLTVPENDILAATVKDVHGTIKVSDVEMTCWKPLPNIEKLEGNGTFNEKGFDIQITGGEQGAVKLKPSHMVINGLNADTQIMTMDALIEAPSKDLLEILDRPPMGYAGKMNINPKDVSGKVEGTLHMSFPLLKDLIFDQIDLNADAKISDGAIQNVAGLIDVSQGAIALSITKDGLSFNGNALLNDVPSTIEWKERFSAQAPDTILSQATINGSAKAQDIKKFGVDMSMISSDVFPITLAYSRGVSNSRLTVNADATAPKLDLDDVFYSKAAGVPFNMAVVLEWGVQAPMVLRELKVRGEKVLIDGAGRFDSNQRLSELTLEPFQMDATKAKAIFSRNKEGVPVLELTGDVLDIRHAFDAPSMQAGSTQPVVQEAKPPSPLEMNLRFKRVITGQKSELNNLSMKGIRDQFGWAYMDVSALAKNRTPFNFSVKPVGGRQVLSMTTPNLGNFLSSMDVTDTMIGGKLAIDGKSEPGDKLRNIFGHIKLDNYRVTNMPALAQLISAISPDGLAAMLGGEGLGFGDLEAEYVWEKNTIVITKAHTASGSLGLTAAGKIDLQRSAIELEGQVIPVYFISRILSAIPLIGDILTGGEGQGVFAATYRVEGPIAKAKVSVNPVSVLAPGILRNILFMDKDIAKTEKQKKR